MKTNHNSTKAVHALSALSMAPGADHDPEHSLETFQATFWAKQIAIAEDERPDIKHAPLPLARIKKVMKSDPDVKV